jgi:hypothetical protein
VVPRSISASTLLSVTVAAPLGSVVPIAGLFEEFGELRMANRFARTVVQQVLFRDVGDVFRVVVFRQKMIEGLLFRRTNLGWYRLVPLLGVRKHRIDVKDHTPKREEAVTDDLSYSKFRDFCFTHGPYLAA